MGSFQLGLGIVLVAVFVLAFAGSWSLREAFNETVWFSAFWVIALAALYAFDQTGFSPISTSPTGIGGGIALLVGFLGMMVRRRRWRKEVALKRAQKAAEQARRKAAGIPEPTMATRLGAAVRAMRKPEERR
jgi:hypothetical protein